MASIAGLLQLQGHRITGSDKAAYPPMSDLLRSLGIPVMEPYSEANLDPAPELVVIGNALSRGNPEVERVLDEQIPFASMAALVHDEFLKGRVGRTMKLVPKFSATPPIRNDGASSGLLREATS